MLLDKQRVAWYTGFSWVRHGNRDGQKLNSEPMKKRLFFSAAALTRDAKPK